MLTNNYRGYSLLCTSSNWKNFPGDIFILLENLTGRWESWSSVLDVMILPGGGYLNLQETRILPGGEHVGLQTINDLTWRWIPLSSENKDKAVYRL
jgi:hypothetical protein